MQIMVKRCDIMSFPFYDAMERSKPITRALESHQYSFKDSGWSKAYIALISWMSIRDHVCHGLLAAKVCLF